MKMYRKSVTKRSGVALFLCVGAPLVGKHKQYSVAKAFEVLQAVGVALQDFNLVVAALGKSVCVGAEKGICNRGKPVVICFSAFHKCGDVALRGFLNPIRKELLFPYTFIF